MNNSFKILPDSLHPIADAAITYFIKQRGVSKGTIAVEESIDADLPFRPTFTGKTTDHYILCVDVAESVYNNSLDDFVLSCVRTAIPVKLFIAIPKGTKDQDYS